MSDMSMVPTVVDGIQLNTAPSRIPPYLISCFAIVAELRSVSHAATIQCIPYAQMAQHIARLEGCVGAPLLDARPGPFRLTELGNTLYAAVRPELSKIEERVQRLTSSPGFGASAEKSINIGLGIWGLAAALRPFVSDMQALNCGLNFVPQNRMDVINPDVVCYLGKSQRQGYEVEPLFGEEIISVCSNKYPVPSDGFDGTSLRYEPLLQLGHPDHREDWHGFLGLDPDSDLPGISKQPYSSFSTYLRAIKSGRGIGVGLAPLFATGIADGSLQIASNRRVWRNRTVFLGVSKRCEYLAEARNFAAILKNAIMTNANVAH